MGYQSHTVKSAKVNQDNKPLEKQLRADSWSGIFRELDGMQENLHRPQFNFPET